jgi:hypothetical protein
MGRTSPLYIVRPRMARARYTYSYPEPVSPKFPYVVFFFAKTQKALRFDSLIGKESIYTIYTTAATSRHLKQLNPLELRDRRDQSAKSTCSRYSPRTSFRSNHIEEIAHARRHIVEVLLDPPCCQHDEQGCPLTQGARVDDEACRHQSTKSPSPSAGATVDRNQDNTSCQMALEKGQQPTMK